MLELSRNFQNFGYLAGSENADENNTWHFIINTKQSWHGIWIICLYLFDCVV